MESSKLLVLDGAAGTYLEQLGVKLHPQLWSSIVLTDENINEARKLHAAYLNAGADIITSCTYQASIEGFTDLGYTCSQARDLITRGVQTAQSEASKISNSKQVAAGLGSYGAYLCNGAEYSGDYSNTVSNSSNTEQNKEELITKLKTFWLPRVESVLISQPDYLLFETVPNKTEIEVIAAYLAPLAKLPHTKNENKNKSKNKVLTWLSLSVKIDEINKSVCLADGTPIEDLKNLVKDIDIIGANCYGVQSTLLVAEKLSYLNKPLALYPNDGSVYDGINKEWKYEASKSGLDLELLTNLIEYKVKIVGGCCNTTPQNINNIAGNVRLINDKINH